MIIVRFLNTDNDQFLLIAQILALETPPHSATMGQQSKYKQISYQGLQHEKKKLLCLVFDAYEPTFSTI